MHSQGQVEHRQPLGDRSRSQPGAEAGEEGPQQPEYQIARKSLSPTCLRPRFPPHSEPRSYPSQSFPRFCFHCYGLMNHHVKLSYDCRVELGGANACLVCRNPWG